MRGLLKTTVYAACSVDGNLMIFRFKGYTDNRLDFYQNEKYKIWFAVNKMTGRSIASGKTLKEAIANAYSEETVRKVDAVIKTESYKKMCSDFYKGMVAIGAYVENPCGGYIDLSARKLAQR